MERKTLPNSSCNCWCILWAAEIAIFASKFNFDDVNTRIFLGFEMQIGMNEFDHRILSLPKQQREMPEKFWPERGYEPWPLRCRCSATPVELPSQVWQKELGESATPSGMSFFSIKTLIVSIFLLRIKLSSSTCWDFDHASVTSCENEKIDLFGKQVLCWDIGVHRYCRLSL